MPPELFWDGDPQYFYAYLRAYRLNQTRTEESNAFNVDYQAWLTGMYVHRALAVVIGGAFSKRGSVKQQYPKEPISFSRRKAEDRKKGEEAEEALLVQQYSGFRRFVDAMNKNLR